MSKSKIDVHAHILSPTYRQALFDHGYCDMPIIPDWSAESHLAYMDSNGIAKSILSVSDPGTSLTSDQDLNNNLTRECNDYAANVKSHYPDRFGYFASLPLSDIASSLAEIKHVLDGPLKADGIVLYSNHKGLYMGDPILRPILAELNARNAVVFLHPTTAQCGASRERHGRQAGCSSLEGAYPPSLFEFLFDSARSVVDLTISGTACRFENVRWIISHCGGVLPSLLDRMFLFMNYGKDFALGQDPVPVTEQQIREVLARQFWYDLAGYPVPNLIDAMLKFTGKERLLFGSDVPWTPFQAAGALVAHMEQELPRCVGEDSLEMIYHDNAEELLSSRKDT